ncbi:hypothetical protein D3C84_1166770 [compost metagenome]
MLRHSIARYSAAAAARAIESVNIVGGSSAITCKTFLICGERRDCRCLSRFFADPGALEKGGCLPVIQRACQSRSHCKPSLVLPRGRYSQPTQPL